MTETPPILFVIFNRATTAQKVFDQIRKAKPKKLFIVADGPRETVPSDIKDCEEARRIVGTIDWDCEVIRQFSDKNIGIKKNLVAGLKLMFDHCEYGIILEDDCFPDPTFFRTCGELLEKYKDDERIYSINGTNLGYLDENEHASYRITPYMNMWGWATWKRTFEKIDFSLTEIKSKTDLERRELITKALELSDTPIDNLWLTNWQMLAEKVMEPHSEFWDVQWIINTFLQKGLVLSPKANMVQNLGMGDPKASSTKGDHVLGQIPPEATVFPLVHPNEFKWDKKYEQHIRELAYSSLKVLPRVTDFSSLENFFK